MGQLERCCMFRVRFEVKGEEIINLRGQKLPSRIYKGPKGGPACATTHPVTPLSFLLKSRKSIRQ